MLVNEKNTIQYKILEGENFGKMARGKVWQITFENTQNTKCLIQC